MSTQYDTVANPEWQFTFSTQGVPPGCRAETCAPWADQRHLRHWAFGVCVQRSRRPCPCSPPLAHDQPQVCCMKVLTASSLEREEMAAPGWTLHKTRSSTEAPFLQLQPLLPRQSRSPPCPPQLVTRGGSSKRPWCPTLPLNPAQA